MTTECMVEKQDNTAAVVLYCFVPEEAQYSPPTKYLLLLINKNNAC